MKYQKLYNIIFSDNPSCRFKRHCLFWLAVFVYHLLRIGLMYAPEKLWSDLASLLELTLFWGVFMNVIFSYSVVYFLVPKYFDKRKFIQFAIGLILLLGLIQSINILHNFLGYNITASNVIGIHRSIFINMNKAGFIRLFGNPPLICGLLLSLKTLKNWHLEQLKTATLAKENANAELQLLKGQIHPHFLFNTLNNIYSFSLTQSPLAGGLVSKLSDMLNYMIHECAAPLVPLEREIKLIQDYIGLEKVRYGNRLNMEIEIEGNCENKLITPLLIIPFVENCFKHGASVMRGQQWIRLSIHIKDEELDINLSNSRPAQSNGNNKKGIGLANVQKRLQLLYPGKHFLKIESTPDTYVVYLQVSLHRQHVVGNEYKIMPTLQRV